MELTKELQIELMNINNSLEFVQVHYLRDVDFNLIEFTIGWSSIGHVNFNQTLKFTKDLEKAMVFIESKNKTLK